MRNFNFIIPPDLDTRLKAESERTGAPMSEIIRRAVRDYLEESDKRRRRRATRTARAS
jgi:predicted DNA-binding protein